MSDLDSAEKAINLLLETCSKDLKSLTKKNPSERTKQISRCQTKMAEIQIRLDDYGLEVLQLPKDEQPKFEAVSKGLQQRFKELKKELSIRKEEKGGDGNPLTEGLLSKDIDQMNDIELIKMGDDHQQKGKDALGRILINVESANQKADNVNLALQMQEDKITAATEKVKDIQSQTQIAMQYVKYFARQVYTDKILMCLIFLCAIAIIVIIVLKVTKKSSTTVTTSDASIITSST